MAEQSDLIPAFKNVVEKYWNENGRALLLSNLPPLLEIAAPDYRETLGKKSLRSFISETEDAGCYKLVTHATQRSRVGFIPAGENYEFDQVEAASEAAPGKHSDRRAATLAFLHALKACSPAELAQIEIPVSVLVKLLG
jgi:hypothetical protein